MNLDTTIKVRKIIEENINKEIEELSMRIAVIENIVALYEYKYDTEEKIIELTHKIDNNYVTVYSIIEMFDNMCINLEKSL